MKKTSNKIFLSVDIDFWNGHLNSEKKLENYLNFLYKKSKKFKIPMVAVMNHQQILKFVNSSDCNILINIDDHSDLTDINCDELNCGSWVSFVKWQKNGKYIWIHSNDYGFGDCNGSKRIFNGSQKLFKHKDLYWKYVQHKQRRNPPLLNFTNVHFISICQSPSYSYIGLEQIFKNFIKLYNIKYKKGKCDESRSYKKIKLKDYLKYK